MLPDRPQSLVEQWLSRLKNSPPVAIAIVLGILVIGIGQFTGALNEIIGFVKSDPAPSSTHGPVDPACKITGTMRVASFNLWEREGGSNDFAQDLDKIANALRRSECSKRLKVRIEAYANLENLWPYELKELSQSYADDFAGALVKRHIDKNRIRAAGLGEPSDTQSPSRVVIFFEPHFE